MEIEEPVPSFDSFSDDSLSLDLDASEPLDLDLGGGFTEAPPPSTQTQAPPPRFDMDEMASLDTDLEGGEGEAAQDPLLGDERRVDVVHGLIRAALATGGDAIAAMKDPTRGGLASALHEMAAKSGVGIVLDETQVGETAGASSENIALSAVVPQRLGNPNVALRRVNVGKWDNEAARQAATSTRTSCRPR